MDTSPESYSVYFIWKHGAAFLGSRFSNGSIRKPDLWEGRAGVGESQLGVIAGHSN